VTLNFMAGFSALTSELAVSTLAIRDKPGKVITIPQAHMIGSSLDNPTAKEETITVVTFTRVKFRIDPFTICIHRAPTHPTHLYPVSPEYKAIGQQIIGSMNLSLLASTVHQLISEVGCPSIIPAIKYLLMKEGKGY